MILTDDTSAVYKLVIRSVLALGVPLNLPYSMRSQLGRALSSTRASIAKDNGFHCAHVLGSGIIANQDWNCWKENTERLETCECELGLDQVTV